MQRGNYKLTRAKAKVVSKGGWGEAPSGPTINIIILCCKPENAITQDDNDDDVDVDGARMLFAKFGGPLHGSLEEVIHCYAKNLYRDGDNPESMQEYAAVLALVDKIASFRVGGPRRQRHLVAAHNNALNAMKRRAF